MYLSPPVLVVSEQEELGALVVRLLTAYGWPAVLSVDSREALSWLVHRPEVPLLIADGALVDLPVAALIRAARVLHSAETMSVVVLGWPRATSPVDALRPWEADALLPTNFQLSDLLAVVRQLAAPPIESKKCV